MTSGHNNFFWNNEDNEVKKEITNKIETSDNEVYNEEITISKEIC